MLKYNEFSKGGVVSVWIGDFGSDVESDDYINLERRFEEDFGFELNERAMPETAVEAKATPIRTLVDGFSWSNSYAESLVSLAAKNGIDTATSMVILLNFAYDPVRAIAKKDAQLKFIGVIPFE